MHFSRILLGALLTAFIASAAIAQNNVGPLTLDPAFATGGKSEVLFGADSAVTTCYVAYRALPRQFNRIVVAGKIFEPDGSIHFGIAEYDSNGVPVTAFGTNGKTTLEIGSNAIELLPDGSILVAGGFGAGFGGLYGTPGNLIFKIKSDGILDSSFGDAGHVPLGGYGGEFENLDTLHVGQGDTSVRYLATGYGFANDVEGFYALRVYASGQVDSSFVSAPVLSTALRHTVPGNRYALQGHLISNNAILFCGIDSGNVSHIMLCKLLFDGKPDSSFGTNSLLNTGISLQGNGTISVHISSLYDPDTSAPLNLHPGLLVAAPVSGNMAFTVLKFKLDGTLDSTFGVNGYATAPIISNMAIRGLNLSNDGGILVSGSVGNVSAAAKFFPNGAIDTTFGTSGIALLDADSGERANYLIGFVPAPLPPPHASGSAQRFLGIGVSHTASGSPEFLLARYMPVKYAGVTQPSSQASNALQLFPNPVHDVLNVASQTGTIESLTITDALGRIVRSFERPGFSAASPSYLVDLSGLANGAYRCSIRTSAGVAAGQFTVVH